jgi:hypothetical protein
VTLELMVYSSYSKFTIQLYSKSGQLTVPSLREIFVIGWWLLCRMRTLSKWSPTPSSLTTPGASVKNDPNG